MQVRTGRCRPRRRAYPPRWQSARRGRPATTRVQVARAPSRRVHVVGKCGGCVTAVALSACQELRAFDHVTVAQRRPRVANAFRPGATGHARCAQRLDRRHGRDVRHTRHGLRDGSRECLGGASERSSTAGSPRLNAWLAVTRLPSPSSFGASGETAQGRVGLPPRLVQVGADARTVALGQIEGHVQPLLGIAVEGARV